MRSAWATEYRPCPDWVVLPLLSPCNFVAQNTPAENYVEFCVSLRPPGKTLLKYGLSNLLNAECVLHLYWLEFTKYVPFVGFGFV